MSEQIEIVARDSVPAAYGLTQDRAILRGRGAWWYITQGYAGETDGRGGMYRWDDGSAWRLGDDDPPSIADAVAMTQHRHPAVEWMRGEAIIHDSRLDAATARQMLAAAAGCDVADQQISYAGLLNDADVPDTPWARDVVDLIEADWGDAINPDDDDSLHEWADSAVSIYTADLVRWYADHPDHREACSEAEREYGEAEHEDARMMAGQYMLILRLLYAYRDRIAQIAEADD